MTHRNLIQRSKLDAPDTTPRKWDNKRKTEQGPAHHQRHPCVTSRGYTAPFSPRLRTRPTPNHDQRCNRLDYLLSVSAHPNGLPVDRVASSAHGSRTGAYDTAMRTMPVRPAVMSMVGGSSDTTSCRCHGTAWRISSIARSAAPRAGIVRAPARFAREGC